MARIARGFLAVCLILACASAEAASAFANKGSRRQLFQARLGVVTDGSVQAPDATKWSAGAVTAASGPATYKTTTKVVGPDQPSAAFGVNPTGGYATLNTLTKIDQSQGLIPLTKVHVDAKASIANTAAADLAVGTNRVIPTVQNSIYARPTVPLTFPVFSFGGKLLPEPKQSVVINPFAEPDSGDRRRLFQARLGVVTDGSVQAPDAMKWSAGAVTAASGPATYKTTTKVVGPDQPSAAFGVNPTGGYATLNTLTKIDQSQGLIPLTKVHMDAKASIANTAAADLAVGTNRVIPTVQNSIYARPTVPLTFPVFSFGGKLLPEPKQSVVINPFAEPDSGDRRRLANWGSETKTEFKAPSAPSFKATVNPTPGRSNINTVVRAERPSLVVKNEVPASVVTATGNTKVDLAPQPKYEIADKSGKGSWVTVNLARGPATVTNTNEGTVNWPTGSAVAQSNTPLYIQQGTEATLPNPSRYVNVDVKPNNLGALPDGYLQTSSSTTVPIGRK